MSQSLAQLYVHIVFSTKGREMLLGDVELRGRMHGFLSGVCTRRGCPCVALGGTDDHVHLLCRLSKSVSVADLVRDVKRASSKWIQDEEVSLKDFRWQAGYGAFSISPSHVEDLSRYIGDQEAHHRGESFEDEFRRICKKYDVDLDERYVWD